jgi:anti-sigma-K factor RskA
MSMHEQFAEDLSLYALGALEGDKQIALEKHLDDCPACRQELEKMRGDAAWLAFSVSGPRPPANSRQRLMSAIEKEPRGLRAATPARRFTWFKGFEWAVVTAAALLVLIFARQNRDLRQQLSAVQSQSWGEMQQLHQAKDLIASLTSAEAEHFTLVASKTPPPAEGKTIYIRSTGTVIFLASNMPQLPAQKTYELWLIPTSGAPIPAGLFKPDEHGNATVVKPPLPTGVEAKAFAITVEPEAGSPAPTSTPIMVGAQT